ncbi:MAG: DivIVA domain-containing protein [Rhodoglobus sp.]
MALTPEDVVNKRFQPTKFREGYDQDEVDDFLDEVVVELRRLNQENEELRQRLVANDSRLNDLQRSGAQPVSAQPGFAQSSQVATISTPDSAPAVPALPALAAGPTADGLDTGGTNNLLVLARRLHEEHVREGVEKRDALVAEGHAAAARIVAEAESGHRAQIESLDQQRQQLEHRVEELRNFEREYRQKLKGYIEGQLRELDSAGNVLTSSTNARAAGFANNVGAKGADFVDASAVTDRPSPDVPQTSVNFPGFAGS